MHIISSIEMTLSEWIASIQPRHQTQQHSVSLDRKFHKMALFHLRVKQG
jgi:hypothetical protein